MSFNLFSPAFSRSMGLWKRSWSIIYWLPTSIFFCHNVYNIKVISGQSMQVRILRFFHSLANSFNPSCPSKPTLNPNTSTWRDLAIFNRFAVHTIGLCNRDDIVTFRSVFHISFFLFSISLDFEQCFFKAPQKTQTEHSSKESWPLKEMLSKLYHHTRTRKLSCQKDMYGLKV